MIAQRCFSVWEASQGINLEAKRIKLVLWLGLLERFPTMRGEPELSGPPLLQFGFEVGGGIKQPSSPAMVSRFSSHTALSHVHCPCPPSSRFRGLRVLVARRGVVFPEIASCVKGGVAERQAELWLVLRGLCSDFRWSLRGPHICMYSFFSRGENSVRHAGRFIEEKTNGLLCSLEEEPLGSYQGGQVRLMWAASSNKL